MRASLVKGGDEVLNCDGGWNVVRRAVRLPGTIKITYRGEGVVDQLDPGQILTVRRKGCVTGPAASLIMQWEGSEGSRSSGEPRS